MNFLKIIKVKFIIKKDGGDVDKAFNFIVQMYKDKDKSVDSREIIVTKMIATEKTDSIKDTLKFILTKLDEINNK